MANSLVIISSLEVQIQTYTNIEKSRFLLTPNFRILKISSGTFLPQHQRNKQFSHYFEAAANDAFLVHALRSHAEEVPQRRDVAVLGRLVDVVVALARCSTRESSGRLRKLREKIPSKNDIKKKRPKIGESWLLDPYFGLFVWQNCERSIEFKFSDSSLFSPVVCCFDVIFGVQNVPLGCEERCMYQTWGKRLYQKAKNGSEAWNLKV